MKLRLYIYICIACVLISGCSGYEPDVDVNPREVTLDFVLSANDYSILNRALEITGIDLNTGGVTLFAPTNQAFNVLFSQLGVNNVEDVDVATLTQILQYHVITGELFSEELDEEGNSTMVSNRELHVVIPEGSGININGKSNVVDPDRVTQDSLVIHGIDFVLEIPAGNLFEIIAADTNKTVLADALVRTGLDAALSGSAEFTVLAPNDDAFAGIDLSALTDDQLRDILSFHVIPSRLYSQKVPEDVRVPSILGDEADDFERLNIGSLTFNGVETAALNTNGTNGVIHDVEAVIFPQGVISEMLDPNSNSVRTDNDDNGLDLFGAIVEGSGYERFNDISDTSSVYAISTATGLQFSDFANDSLAQVYINNHVFDGDLNLDALSNGDKVTALSGASYYLGFDEDFAYVNGRSRNDATAAGSSDFNYDGDVYIFDQPFTPLPSDSIATALAANSEYELMALAVIAAGRNGSLTSGDNTFFTVNDSVMNALGYDSVALEAVINNPTDDSSLDTIEELQELIDRHTVSSVNFSIYITTSIPTLTNLLGEEIYFALVNGNLVIVEDLKDISSTMVELNAVDILYSNGTIHEIGSALDL